MDTQRLLSSPTQSETIQDHRRQTFWQILFPVILASLVVVGLAVFLIITTGSPAGYDTGVKWAGISLIWLIIPTLLSCFIFLVILVGLIYLMAKALGAVPGLGAKGQYYAARMAEISQNLGNKVASPVIKTKGFFAGARRFRSEVGQKVSGQK